MMVKSDYREALYYAEELPYSSLRIDEEIQALLCENHGVGILGGSFDPGFPIVLVSDLVLRMLGYESIEEFEAATSMRMDQLVCGDCTEAEFAALSGAHELHLCSKTGELRTRIFKRDLAGHDGGRVWLASVCDTDDLYHVTRKVDRMAIEQKESDARYTAKLALANEELARANAELISTNAELERQKKELEHAVEEARLANLSKADFLRRMSHDIRTPINGIRGMIEMMGRFEGDEEKQRECRDKVWEASGYLLSLVNSVLDMNKLESGGTTLDSTPFDVIELLRESNSLAQIQANQRHIGFTVNRSLVDVTHKHLLGSPKHLKQVLMNLAQNAVLYNKEGGSVTVWCKEIGFSDDVAVLKFACIDTGIGMSDEFQKHAFEPFMQEERDNARTTYRGTGLGLSISKGLVEQMGGTIDFTSHEGEGTSFFVTIPFKIDGDFKEEPEPVNVDAVDLAPITVLLVEDNDINLEIAQFFLEEHGAKVICARNGQQAVDLFAASDEGSVDLVLMDIMMPVMNGYEATQAIRAMDRADAVSVPIFALTANAFSEDVRHSLDVGMNEHLSKPLSTEKLILTIARYVMK